MLRNKSMQPTTLSCHFQCLRKVLLHWASDNLIMHGLVKYLFPSSSLTIPNNSEKSDSQVMCPWLRPRTSSRAIHTHSSNGIVKLTCREFLQKFAKCDAINATILWALYSWRKKSLAKRCFSNTFPLEIAHSYNTSWRSALWNQLLNKRCAITQKT